MDSEKYQMAADAIETAILQKEVKLTDKEWGVYIDRASKSVVFSSKKIIDAISKDVVFFHYTDCKVCAVGAYLLGEILDSGEDYYSSLPRIAAKRLGVEVCWIEGVICGFDGVVIDNMRNYVSWDLFYDERALDEVTPIFENGYGVGKWLREKYLPGGKYLPMTQSGV